MLLIPIWETPLNKALGSSKQTPQSVLCHGPQIMGSNISVFMHDLVWLFPPLKLSLRNENDAYGNMHHVTSPRSSAESSILHLSSNGARHWLSNDNNLR